MAGRTARAKAVVDTAWWEQFDDPVLNDLKVPAGEQAQCGVVLTLVTAVAAGYADESSAA